MGPGYAALHGPGAIPAAHQCSLETPRGAERRHAYNSDGKEPDAAVPDGATVPRGSAADSDSDAVSRSDARRPPRARLTDREALFGQMTDGLDIVAVWIE